MDAFEQGKYSEAAFFKLMLSNSVIVSYGTITAIDIDSVEVTLSVSNKAFAEKISCTFMNIGNEQFSLIFKPAMNMRVVVFSPHKGTNGMYDSYTQIKDRTGKNFIATGSPAVYSSQQSFCFPLLKSTSSSLSSLLVDNGIMSLQMAHDLVGSITGAVDLFISSDTAIEFNEGSKHTRNYEGDLTETFGMVEGIKGVEKSGTYTYEETFGKYSSVKKNYESGAEITVGKAYAKPFLTDKGALGDSSAPVTINMGTKAPLTLNMGAGAPITLNFGSSAMTITLSDTDGLDVAVTGSVPVNITAATGLLSFGNSTGTLADVINGILDAVEGLVTTGGPTTQQISPATVALLEAARAKMATIFK